MRGRMPVALFAMVFGALEFAGGAQEMIYLGFLQSERYPLIAGGLLFAAGIALLVRSQLTSVLAQATAWISVPVFILTGVVTHRAGWPITAVGIGYPLFLALFCMKSEKSGEATARS